MNVLVRLLSALPVVLCAACSHTRTDARTADTAIVALPAPAVPGAHGASTSGMAAPAEAPAGPLVPGGTPTVARCGGHTDSAAIAASNGLVRRHGDTLSISISNGQTKVSTNYNMNVPDSAADYRYCGRLRLPRGLASFHIVDAQHYESGYIQVVNASTGHVAVLDNLPILSPDGSRFAVAQFEGNTCESISHLDVWQFTNATPHLEWTVEPSRCAGYKNAWSARDVEWHTADSITFRVTFQSASPDGDVDRDDPTPRWLVRGPTGWTLDPIAPPAAR